MRSDSYRVFCIIELTLPSPSAILKLHIWEISLTVRLSNPHMREQENMVEKIRMEHEQTVP